MHPGYIGAIVNGRRGSAAGRYQIEKPLYDELSGRLGLHDFTPDTQDLMAVEQLRRKGVLDKLLSGDNYGAISKAAPTWVSMPYWNGSAWGRRVRDQPIVDPMVVNNYYERQRDTYGGQ